MEKGKLKIEIDLLEPTTAMNSELNTIILMTKQLYDIYSDNSKFKGDDLKRIALSELTDILQQELTVFKSMLNK